MKISMTVPLENLQTANGFGQASYQIVSSLQRLGHEVKLFDATAPVELAFCQPPYWQWSSRDSYKIGYVPWESTEMPKNWKYFMQSADELWTPSPVIAEWFPELNFKVYEHGVDAGVWTRKKRVRNGPVKLLHIGEPAVRKAGPLVLQTFNEEALFRGEATLTIKSHGLTQLESNRADVTIIEEEYSEDDLVRLFHDHDVLIYPSYGEGFGLIPLQAMSTGMPVLITKGWAPYEDLVPEELLIATDLRGSPWPKTHPGKMLHPQLGDLASAMRYIVQEFDHYAEWFHMLAIDVQEHYDWDRLTKEAFSPIVEKFEQ